MNKIFVSAISVCFRSLLIVLAALGLTQSAYPAITIKSYWPLGEAAAIGTDTSSVNDGTLNPFNNTTGSTVLTATPSSAAGSTAYAHTSGANYQGIWMFGAGSTAQTIPSDNWGVQLNVRVTTLPTTGTYKSVFGMAEGVSAGLVIEANNVGGTVYFDVNKQGIANYIIPRNASVTVTANTWYNLALVKNGGTVYFYVNGALAGSNAGAVNTSGLFGLGFEQNVGTHQLSGDFDEARFFTFAAGAFSTNDLSMTKRTVTYDGNGYTGGTAPVDSNSYFPGTPVTVTNSGSLTRTGYAFNSWNTAADGSGTAYSPAATFNIGDSNTTLYAQWTVATATITAPTNFPDAISTTYGTASSSTSVAVSGTNLVADITATAPSHLEISGDNATFGSTVTFTQSVGSASGTLYARLMNNAPVSGSPYNSQSVTLSSSGATPVNVATTASGNTVAAKNLTVPSATAGSKMFDGNSAGTVTGTLQAAEAFGTGSSGDGAPYLGDTLTVSAPGTFSSSAAGGPYTVTAGTFTLGGSSAGNYTLTQPTGLSLTASIYSTAIWTQLAGGSWNTSTNWTNSVIAAGAGNTADFSTLTMTANTTVTLDSSPTNGGLVFGDVGGTYNWTLNAGTPAGILTLVSASTPTIAVSNQTATIAAPLAGTNGLSKTGAGTLTLTKNTSGALSLTANNGTLKLAVSGLAYNNAGGVGNGASLTVNSGATLQIGAGYNIGYQQAVNINGGTLDLTNNITGDGQNYTLNLNFTGGGSIISTTGSSLRWGELANAIINVNGTNPATISSILRMIPGNSRTGTINVVDAGGSLDFSGAIIDYPGIPGGVPLIKTGAGTLVLDNVTHTYTSATIVSNGTLVVNGFLPNSPVTVAGGKLCGNGTLGSAAEIKFGGTLAAGTSASLGTLYLNGALTLDTGCTNYLRISKTGGSPSSDQISGGGTFVFHGTLVVPNVTSDTNALVLNDTFSLFAGGTPSGAFDHYVMPSLPAGLSWDVSQLPTAGTISIISATATPTFNPGSGGYIGAQAVTISCITPGAVIYYSTDNFVTTSNLYSTPITVPVDTNMTISAMALATGYSPSGIATATYATETTPFWINPAGGSWAGTFNWTNNIIGQGRGVTDYFNTLTLAGADAVVTLDSSPTVGGLVFADAGSTYNWIINPGSPAGTLTLDSEITPVIAVNNQAATIAVALWGTNGLSKTGAGTLTLSGTNTYSGATTIQAGSLVAGSSGALPAGGAVIVGTNATLNVDSASGQLNWYKFVSSTTVQPGGTLTLAGGATEIHNLTLVGGTLAGSNPNTNYGSWGFNKDSTNNSVEPILVTGGLTSTISAMNFDSAWPYLDTAYPLTFSVDAGSVLDVTGTIGGNSGHAPTIPVIKTGAGTMRLENTNSYTGITTVSNGTLLVNGLIGSGGASVESGAILGGSGTINGVVTVNSGGILSPGSSIGTLTLGSSPSLSGTVLMEINRTNTPANADRLAVSGSSLTYGGGLTVTNTGPALALNDTFTLFSADGGLGGAFAATNLPSLPSGLAWSWNATAGTLSVVNPVATNPTNITFTVSGGILTLSWPADHLGWSLQIQTNSLSAGLGSNWITVPGSASVISTNIPIYPANPAVFFRLVYP